MIRAAGAHFDTALSAQKPDAPGASGSLPRSRDSSRSARCDAAIVAESLGRKPLRRLSTSADGRSTCASQTGSMTSTTSTAYRSEHRQVLADLSIGVLFLCWAIVAPGFVVAALNAAPWWGGATAAQEHQVIVYLVIGAAVSLIAPVIGLGVALWNERRAASLAFCLALALSIAGNAWLLAQAAKVYG
jgi:hypothetical protein